MAKHPAHLLELAKKGALHRYNELKAELADLVKAFPHLEYGSAISPGVPRQRYESAPAERSKRRRLSPAARRAASVRMRKYWARRRAAGKKK